MRYLLLVLALLLGTQAYARDQYVQSYTRSNGTYVQGYMRTAPDNNVWNNYSTKGNINPYTGQPGTIDPYNQIQPPPPPSSFPSFPTFNQWNNEVLKN